MTIVRVQTVGLKQDQRQLTFKTQQRALRGCSASCITFPLNSFAFIDPWHPQRFMKETCSTPTAMEGPTAFPIVVKFLCCQPLDSLDLCKPWQLPWRPCQQPALQAAFKILKVGSEASDRFIFQAGTQKKIILNFLQPEGCTAAVVCVRMDFQRVNGLIFLLRSALLICHMEVLHHHDRI